MEVGIPEGICLEDAKELAQMLEGAQADAIHVMEFPGFLHPPMCEPPGSMVYLAEAIKKVVSVPVIAGGRSTPEVAEQVLREGKADLIFLVGPFGLVDM